MSWFRYVVGQMWMAPPFVAPGIRWYESGFSFAGASEAQRESMAQVCIAYGVLRKTLLIGGVAQYTCIFYHPRSSATRAVAHYR